MESNQQRASKATYLLQPIHVVACCLKLHLTAALTTVLLALLKLLVQEGARLLISLVVVEAIVKHALVVAARSHHTVLLIHHTLTLSGHGCLLLLFLRSFVVAAAAAAHDGTDGLVRNSGTGAERHTLSNGATNAREHAAARLGGCGHGTLLRSRSAGRRRGRARLRAGRSSRAACWGTSSTTTTLSNIMIRK
jgi:hypothetical protein